MTPANPPQIAENPADSRVSTLRDSAERRRVESERPERLQRSGRSDQRTFVRGTTALNNHIRIASFRKSDDDISDRPYAGETVKPFRLYDDETVGTFRLYDEEPTEDGLQPIGASLIGAAFRLHMTGADDIVSERELEKALSLVLDPLKEQARDAWAKGLTKCESAIEKVLLPWLVCQRYEFFSHHPAVLFAGETHAYEPMTLAVIPQLPIGRFRADFALAGSRGGLVRFVVVECDGKEFHDGVENVKRDLNRDVSILANNRVLDVVRFDGKSILQNPQWCAEQAARAVREAWRKGNPATAAKFEGTAP